MPQPKLLSKPWASDGLKNNIPAERNGGLAQEAATYAEGFPSITMTPISVGGKPPSGKDMNGVLYEISAHTVWQNQGGRYRFDQAFCDAIGGYPKGAVLINDTLDTEYISLVDANTHNPNSGNNTGKWAIHAGKGLKASTTQAGSTQLLSATNSEREDIAATPKAVKTAYDKAVAAERLANGKAATGHTHTMSEVHDLNKALDAVVEKAVPSYQRIGNFDVIKFANGVMIQTGRYTAPTGFTQRWMDRYTLVWAVAFADGTKPKIWATQTSEAKVSSDAENNHISITVNSWVKFSDALSSNTQCVFWAINYDGDGGGRSASFDFLAIGRWK